MVRGLSAGLLLLLVAGCASSGEHEPAAPAIAWAEWGPEPFARARAEGKPILISVVAGWCHWCHVMDDQTYGDPAVAATIAREWVAVRVDSDARPDLGERWRRWGWPATALLGPGAEPILCRRGYQEAASFRALLERVAEDLREGRSPRDAAELPREAGEGVPPAGELGPALQRLRQQLDEHWDPQAAGWGRGWQRYPLAEPVEHALLRARRQPGQGEWRARALRALTAYQALIDPVAGGMFQYSDDGAWGSPHTEKIAPVQAGALEAYSLAFLETGDPRWLVPARLVARFLRERLGAPGGGFFASQDADPPAGAGISGAEYFALDAAARARLGEPRIDRAVWADLNGLLIRGLALFGAAAGEPAAIELAANAMERLLLTHRTPGGAFTHGPRAADASGVLHLSDQVALARAALALHAATGHPRWLALAEDLARVLGELEDPRQGGFFAASEDPAAAAGAFAARRKPFQENALAARFLLELAALRQGDAALRQRAAAALRAQADPGLVASWGRMTGALLLALELEAEPPLVIELVVTPAQLAAEDGGALHRAALRELRAGRLLHVRAPAEGEPAGPFLRACGPRSCSALVRDPALLGEALRETEGAGD